MCFSGQCVPNVKFGSINKFQLSQLGGREVPKAEVKRREAVWDLFQSELVFLIDHLMVLKNVSWQNTNVPSDMPR